MPSVSPMGVCACCNRDVHIHADATLIAALASDLREARFTSESIRAAWGVAADNAFARGTRVPALRALKDRTDATAVLARFFVLGVSQPRTAVAAALPSLGVSGLQELGLATGDDVLAPTALIRPQSFVDEAGAGEWWVASDLDETALGGPLPDDHVLGVGGASLTLAALQVPTRTHRVFDLGTGCGIQALRARRHAAHVVATDISENALAFARFNALLNGVSDIEVRAGSLFEPVAGETFDRIVSNPPFVITPRRDDVPAYEYRDGGMQGDDLVAAVFAGVGEHLAPGGIAQFLGNWEYRWGTDGLDRVRAWVENAPVALDAWVIEREQLDPAEYAALWIRDGGTVQGTAAHEQLLDAWLADFAHRNVTTIGFGYVLLRRPLEGDVTLRRFERVTTPIPAEGTIGAHLADILETHDTIAELTDDSLAAMHLVTAPDVTEKRHYLPGAEDPTVIELNQGAGFGRALSVDPDLAALVGACDGELSIQQISDAIAALMEVDPAALRADLLPRVRELLMTGFLRVRA